ncbi:MAG: cysteine desulfurase family protein [Polyangiaceae bacterium]
MKLVYLDHNATTPPLAEVIAAMNEAASSTWANPSSVHRAGRDARAKVDDAREAIARLADASARDVVLTSGGTEANNLGILRAFPRDAITQRRRGLLITSRLEHPSVTAVAESLIDDGVRVIWIEPQRDGTLSLASIEQAITTRISDEPCLIAIHAVHHETGVIQDVRGVLSLIAGSTIDLHVDAVQAAGRVDHELWRGAPSVAIAGHKLRGPKGIGAIVTQPGVQLLPVLRGGPQERGLRPGTVDPIAASGLAVAARVALDEGPVAYSNTRPLRDRIESAVLALGERHGAHVARTTQHNHRAPHVSHLLIDRWRGDELVAALDLEGVCVSSGSACAAGTAEPSPAITALVGAERAVNAVRISLSPVTTGEEIERAIQAFDRVLARSLATRCAGERLRRVRSTLRLTH